MRRKDKSNNGAIAIGYTRVSTRSQAEEGASLPAQETRIADWCRFHGYTLQAVYSDPGISGRKIENRPGLQAALEAVCKAGGVLAVYSLSRLARNTRETLEIGERLERAGADLASVTEDINTRSAAGRMIFRLMSVLAEFESELLGERTSLGMQQRKAEGKRFGEAPYGYRLEAGSLIPVEEEQAVILAAVTHRKAGHSLRAVQAALNASGYQSRAGKPFHLAQIERILNAQRESVVCQHTMG